MFANRKNLDNTRPFHQLPVELNCRIFQFLEKFDKGEARVVNNIWNRFILLEEMRRIGLQVFLAHSLINDTVRKCILKNKIIYSQFSHEDKLLLAYPPGQLAIKKRLLEIGLKDEKAAIEIIQNNKLNTYFYKYDKDMNGCFKCIIPLAMTCETAAIALLTNPIIYQRLDLTALNQCAKKIDLNQIDSVLRERIHQENSDVILKNVPEGSDERLEMIEALKLSVQLQAEVERKRFEKDLDIKMQEMQEYYNKMREKPQNKIKNTYLDEDDLLLSDNDDDMASDSSDCMSFTDDTLSDDENDIRPMFK